MEEMTNFVIDKKYAVFCFYSNKMGKNLYIVTDENSDKIKDIVKSFESSNLHDKELSIKGFAENKEEDHCLFVGIKLARAKEKEKNSSNALSKECPP